MQIVLKALSSQKSRISVSLDGARSQMKPSASQHPLRAFALSQLLAFDSLLPDSKTSEMCADGPWNVRDRQIELLDPGRPGLRLQIRPTVKA